MRLYASTVIGTGILRSYTQEISQVVDVAFSERLAQAGSASLFHEANTINTYQHSRHPLHAETFKAYSDVMSGLP